MIKLDTLTLAVTDPAAQRRFYCEVLGMSVLDNEQVGYGGQQLALQFEQARAPYRPAASDLYWKIAISVPNIELACHQLAERGVDVTAPKQFRDVGYLAKATDPEGFSIELIDHWFEGERPTETCDESQFGGGPHISLLTLRTADISTVEPQLLNWGMVPLSVQPVQPYGFTLYFYAFTEETPPCGELMALENRSWVYRRPYTVLELQHVEALEDVTIGSGGGAGYRGATFSNAKTPFRCAQLGLATDMA